MTAAHKTMTPEEYAAMPIVGWHLVCRDYDGAGGVGVRFIADGDLESVVQDAFDMGFRAAGGTVSAGKVWPK